MKREVVQTADGSMTIHIPEMNENYHSGHGALQEAKHVFLQNGLLEFKDRGEVAVFEMGFGTGLNAFLTMEYCELKRKKLRYTGIEAFPVDFEMAKAMKYESSVDSFVSSYFDEIHKCTWNEVHQLTDLISFQKLHLKIENYIPANDTFDLIYFDAFGPRAQGDMWEISILTKMHQILKPGGLFVTYCAKGQLRRDLKSLGFKVESLPGPPGKREMTRGWK
jgi:tRNA U34 5-methylaminomethyl-2-thiouridine-forming methyltransferase MnmC